MPPRARGGWSRNRPTVRLQVDAKRPENSAGLRRVQHDIFAPDDLAAGQETTSRLRIPARAALLTSSKSMGGRVIADLGSQGRTVALAELPEICYESPRLSTDVGSPADPGAPALPRQAFSLDDAADAFARNVLGGLTGAEALIAVHDVRKLAGPHRAVHPRAALARKALHILHAEGELVAKNPSK